MTESDASDFQFRPAALEDAPHIWRLVRDSGVLDENSCYLYLLLCRDFSETTVVAVRRDELAGFVTAYRPPERDDVLFVWQIAVAESARRRGLALQMMHALVERCRPQGVRTVEATIAESNTASQRLFAALARELDVPLEVRTGFRAADFQFAEHEDEPTISVGPLAGGPNPN